MIVELSTLAITLLGDTVAPVLEIGSQLSIHTTDNKPWYYLWPYILVCAVVTVTGSLSPLLN